MRAQLVITLQDDGQVGIQGPLSDPILCYGLLELAKDALRRFSQEPKPLIQPVAANVIPMPRNGG